MNMRSVVTVGCFVLGVAALASVANAGDPKPIEKFDCSKNWIHYDIIGQVLPDGLQGVQPRGPALAAGPTITINAGPGLLAVPAAMAAFQRSADTWEKKFRDNVAISINADLADLGEGILGSTGSTSCLVGYDSIRNALIADADPDETIVNQIPLLADWDVILPPGFGFTAWISATKGNLSALGFNCAPGNADATIAFNTDFLPRFDYDSTDGIGPTKFDFEAIATHEIGHVLGFVSRVDGVDVTLNQGGTATVDMRLPDIFRLRPGDGAAAFPTAPRIGSPGDFEAVQMFYDGVQELMFSTAVYFGDGNQASHWKADDITGTTIGIMDPTLGFGQHEEVSVNDERFYGIIGWDRKICFVDCSDGNVCSHDECDATVCSHWDTIYGDVDGSFFVNIIDVFCALDAFGGQYDCGYFSSFDIHPCPAGNGAITIFDIFAILDAFQGEDPCGCL